MSWYNNYKEEWKEIIETVAAEIKRSNVIVERDLIHFVLVVFSPNMRTWQNRIFKIDMFSIMIK